MADIELPQLGESVTEGTITRWFKAVGDQVAEDEPLFEVSTDKVDSEVPSPASGYLAEILVEEGDTVDVGTKIAVLSDAPPGEGGGSGDTSAPAEPEADQAEAPAEPEAAPEPEPEPEAPQAEPDPEASTDAGPPPEESESNPEPAPAEAEPEPAKAEEPAPAPAPSAPPSGDAPLLSPVVRRLLDEAGADPSAIQGTGPGGRITRADVEDHLRAGTGSAAPAAPSRPAPSSPAPGAPAAPPAPAAAPKPAAPRTPAPAAGSDTTVPLNKIRTITSEHMVRSKATSPHVYVATEVDYERVDRVRKAHKDAFKAEEGVSLTYLPFIARALIEALAEYPNVNASMGDGSDLVVHGSVHLGVAVDLDHEGLIVPVVHDAQDQRLAAIARRISELAGRAKARKLTADDITGGTVTITNVGSTGNLFLLPIINQPQVMILATDGIKRRPVVVDDGLGGEAIVIHSVGNLTLGWDHRAFDGAYASEFLARVKEILETRDWETEL
jgi:pyruvate dehydrogenase E2 component (dihydrolipoamide acetyltransferase)